LLSGPGHRVRGRSPPCCGPADFTAVNLETSVTSRGAPQPKTYHFRNRACGPSPRLRDGGRRPGHDGETTMCWTTGPSAWRTRSRRSGAARFPYVGDRHGRGRRVGAPYVTTVKGMRIAVVGVSQVGRARVILGSDGQPARRGPTRSTSPAPWRAVRAARRLAPHRYRVHSTGGTERRRHARTPNQLSLARKLAAAGASHHRSVRHAHMLQGSGWLGHTFVAYGMGQFPCGGRAPTARPPASWN